jgi:hypothetical protein
MRTGNENLISLYEIERCYGGPEEGGWWYDFYELVEVAIELPLKHRDYAWTFAGILNCEDPQTQSETRYSANGGADRQYIVESERGEYETTERPHYE